MCNNVDAIFGVRLKFVVLLFLFCCFCSSPNRQVESVVFNRCHVPKTETKKSKMSQVQKILQEPVTRTLRRSGMRAMWLKFEVQIHKDCWKNVMILTYHLMELCAAFNHNQVH